VTVHRWVDGDNGLGNADPDRTGDGHHLGHRIGATPTPLSAAFIAAARARSADLEQVRPLAGPDAQAGTSGDVLMISDTASAIVHLTARRSRTGDLALITRRWSDWYLAG